MTLEQRNAQKLNNLLNMANINVKNRDIYFFLKCNAKIIFNKVILSPKDSEIISGHISAFTAELSSSKWDLKQFDPKKYKKFLDDLFSKIDFRKVDNNFMYKCRDLLEISPIKDDLYKKQMNFFDKKLPKIGGNTISENNNMTPKTLINTAKFVNNIKKNNQTNIQNQPVNPFADINIGNANINNNINKQNQPVNPFAGMNLGSNATTIIDNNINKQNQPQNPFADINLGSNTNIITNNTTKQNQPVNPFEGMTNNNLNNNNNLTTIQNQPVNNLQGMNQNIININQVNDTNNSMPVNPFANMSDSSNPFTMNFESPANNINNINNQNEILHTVPKNELNNMNNNNNMEPNHYKPKQIPDFLKDKIIKELNIISGEIVKGEIENCRIHSVEALLYFKQIFPD